MLISYLKTFIFQPCPIYQHGCSALRLACVLILQARFEEFLAIFWDLLQHLCIYFQGVNTQKWVFTTRLSYLHGCLQIQQRSIKASMPKNVARFIVFVKVVNLILQELRGKSLPSQVHAFGDAYHSMWWSSYHWEPQYDTATYASPLSRSCEDAES